MWSAAVVCLPLPLDRKCTAIRSPLTKISTVREPCESDFVVVSAGATGISEAPVQIVFGEAKSEGAFDAQDVRKLGRLADAVPRELADAFVLFSKTGTFTSDEIALARTLNTEHRRRVILWSREELEPYYPYERSKDTLGDRWLSGTLNDLAKSTHALFFKEAPQSSGATRDSGGPPSGQP
jgi:hypothetical protein